MKISTIRIENFRGIRRLDLKLDDVTVLIGENNSGKTSVLDAIRICLRRLGPRRRVVFDTLDFHLPDVGAEPSSSDSIGIEVTFSERAPDDWSRKLIGRLNREGILQVDDDGRSHVLLRVTCAYDPTTRDFVQNWSFLNLSRQSLPGAKGRALSSVQREVSYFYLPALRDAARHFDSKGPFWRPFLKDSQLPVDKETEIKRKLKEVNELVVGSHASFDRVQRGLRKLQKIVPLAAADVVSVEAVPGRIFDMLAKAQINLGTTTGAKIPIWRHGEGTQSLAVLMLFSAFLEAWPEGAPIIGMEEPEAHLHPTAIRVLGKLIQGFSGQKLISTHSGDLIAEVDIHSIVRLVRTQQGIKSFRIRKGLLSNEETRKFSYHVRRVRGDLLFARCWLLVEGETEAWIYPAAARAIHLDLHREGVRLVEYRQSDVGLLAKVANALGIAWYCVGDDDTERPNTERKVNQNLKGAKVSERVVFPYENMEIHLLSNGYDSVYDQFMPEENRRRITAHPEKSGYWSDYSGHFPSRKKTRAAGEVAVEMVNRGKRGVTKEIRRVLKKAVFLARGL